MSINGYDNTTHGDDDDAPYLALLKGTSPLLPRLSSTSWLHRVLFLGTGTSGQVPAIHCLSGTNEEQTLKKSRTISCDACRDAIRPGSKNRRGCCSVALIGGNRSRKNGIDLDTGAETEDEMIIIDVGPTFYSAAVSHFHRNQVPPRIAGVLLTHGHADAMLGLDSLRAWTLGGVLQDWVDVYLTKETFEVAKGAFPYLVDTSKATGGGGVGALRWNIIDGVSAFEVGVNKIQVIPLPVEHGFVSRGGPPFPTLGFRVDSFSYISDCHRVPAETANLVAGSDCVVIDSLMPRRHVSHFSVSQAVSFLLSLPPSAPSSSEECTSRHRPRPRLGILTDLTHLLEHNALQHDLHAFTKKLRHWRRQKGDCWDPFGRPNERKGEGSGPRWWRSVWDEDEAEQDGGRIALKANAVDEFVGDQRQGSSSEDGSQTLLPHVPDIRVAWDGMVVDFDVNGLSDS